MQFRYTILLLSLFASIQLGAQTAKSNKDSSGVELTRLPAKYLDQVSAKSDKYYAAVTSKTEKTLERLARFETKLKAILEKTSPETAQRLFGNNQLTFSGLLEKYRQGKVASDQYRSRYDSYRDKLTTTMAYLGQKRQFLDSSVLKPLGRAQEKTARLNEQMRQTEAVEEFIKERKKQLMEVALKLAAKNPYLKKISKESYYYLETLKNYREIFSNPKKAEETALTLLNKIPAFQEFLRRNSMLASLFRVPGDPITPASLAGLQTRAQVNGLIQQQLAAGGPGAMQQFQQNIQAAQSQLTELKNKILKNGGSSSDANLAEGFKPNSQKTKTFLQRLEFSTNIQTQGARSFFPVTSDMALSLGYKLNDKSIVGVGASYKMGFGRGWEHIKFTSEGMGLRSFIDWKIKGNFWISGGYELNYRSAFRDITVLSDLSAWQQSGLVGLSKTVPVKTKFFKKTKLMLLWDFLSYSQQPRTQPVIFRVGYSF